MTLDRRTFMAATAGALAWAGLPSQRAIAGLPPRRYISCVSDGTDDFVACVDQNGTVLWRHALPDRGHGVAWHPGRIQATVFARRPGTFAIVLDSVTGEQISRIDSSPGRHFYGHGLYTPDGRALLTCENAYDSGDGVIGIYDVTDGYKRLGEFASHGVGPHELKWRPDGRTLVIANGGIRTHPAQGRAKLNLDTMRPSLVYLDPATEQVFASVRLDASLHQLSIRHITVNQRGDTAFAMQFQGSKSQRVPLVGLHTAAGQTHLLHAPDPLARHLRHYMGSVAYDASGSVIAATAPRGGMAVFWDGKSGNFLGHIKAADVCGVAPAGAPGEVFLTAGDGALRRVDTRSGAVTMLAAPSRAIHWDNHVGVSPA